MEQSGSIYITHIKETYEENKNTPNISPIKPEIRTWYAFEGPLADVVHNKRFFFAWKEGCLMGNYTTLEEATASLSLQKNARQTLIPNAFFFSLV
jgi:hypothetical protein